MSTGRLRTMPPSLSCSLLLVVASMVAQAFVIPNNGMGSQGSALVFLAGELVLSGVLLWLLLAHAVLARYLLWFLAGILLVNSLETLAMIASGEVPGLARIEVCATVAALASGCLSILLLLGRSRALRSWLDLEATRSFHADGQPLAFAAALSVATFLLFHLSAMDPLNGNLMALAASLLVAFRGLVSGRTLSPLALERPSAADRYRSARDSLRALPIAQGAFLATLTLNMLIFRKDATGSPEAFKNLLGVVVVDWPALFGFYFLAQLGGRPVAPTKGPGPGMDVAQGVWVNVFLLTLVGLADLAFITATGFSVFLPHGPLETPDVGPPISRILGAALVSWQLPTILVLALVVMGSLAASLRRPGTRGLRSFFNTLSILLALGGLLAAALEIDGLWSHFASLADGDAWQAALVAPWQTLLATLALTLPIQAINFWLNRQTKQAALPLREDRGPPFYRTGLLAVMAVLQFLGMLVTFDQGGPVILVLVVMGVFTFFSSLNSRRMEQELAEKTRHLDEKIAENETLLLNILPEPIARRLKAGESTIADSFPSVSVLFADIVGFTMLSQTMGSRELVGMLDTLFRSFDLEARERGVEKIKTIGDCYMAVAGIPVAVEDHADRAVQLGLAFLRRIEEFNMAHGTGLRLRIGINSGQVVAGVIGHHKYIYDLWGDAVNTASRMESHGVPGALMLSDGTRDSLRGDYRIRDNGVQDIKGKGPMRTYLVELPGGAG